MARSDPGTQIHVDGNEMRLRSDDEPQEVNIGVRCYTGCLNQTAALEHMLNELFFFKETLPHIRQLYNSVSSIAG